jgi:predicted dehydrogenase
VASTAVPRYKPIGVGIVGLSAGGGWAAIAHVPTLAGVDGYELRALSTSSATMAVRRPRVRHSTTGEIASKTAEDQVAVIGVLEGGAVAAVHVRGGTSRATDFHWEINGTDGDLVVKIDSRTLWMGRIRLFAGR